MILCTCDLLRHHSSSACTCDLLASHSSLPLPLRQCTLVDPFCVISTSWASTLLGTFALLGNSPLCSSSNCVIDLSPSPDCGQIFFLNRVIDFEWAWMISSPGPALIFFGVPRMIRLATDLLHPVGTCCFGLHFAVFHRLSCSFVVAQCRSSSSVAQCWSTRAKVHEPKTDAKLMQAQQMH